MTRAVTIADLERLAQKPDFRHVGNWMARRITRPLALRLTYAILPWRISAGALTCLACAVAAAAASALAWGTIASWIAGAALLHLWYLLDHVDGQLARYHGTASLDGTQLDYLMHHTINLLVPYGIGWGLFLRHAEPWWLLGAGGWGLALLLLGLQHDARYKAFMGRLKRLHGNLLVQGGGGARPSPTPPIPRNSLRFLAWLARKTCEIHVLINVLSMLALGMWVVGDSNMWLARLWLTMVAPLSIFVAAATIVRSHHRGNAEHEFALWFVPPPGCKLDFRDGWWAVEPQGAIGSAGETRTLCVTGSASENISTNTPAAGMARTFRATGWQSS